MEDFFFLNNTGELCFISLGMKKDVQNVWRSGGGVKRSPLQKPNTHPCLLVFKTREAIVTFTIYLNPKAQGIATL